ncbi:hypothetical protein EHLJMEHL_05059 [Vreelandella titanicae]
MERDTKIFTLFNRNNLISYSAKNVYTFLNLSNMWCAYEYTFNIFSNTFYIKFRFKTINLTTK